MHYVGVVSKFFLRAHSARSIPSLKYLPMPLKAYRDSYMSSTAGNTGEEQTAERRDSHAETIFSFHFYNLAGSLDVIFNLMF